MKATNQPMNIRKQITIKGSNVQRCGFRKAAMDMAKILELAGTAMYIDHDLLIEVEGDDKKVDIFSAWAELGPTECDITEVQSQEMPVAGISSFKVVHGIVKKLSA